MCGVLHVTRALIYVMTYQRNVSFVTVCHCNVIFVGWKHAFVTSNTTPSSGGRPFHTINLQTTIAFREMGKGYSSMRTFTSMMNMPPPMRANAYYDKINNTLHVVYNDVAEQSMHNAAEETRHSIKEALLMMKL